MPNPADETPPEETSSGDSNTSENRPADSTGDFPAEATVEGDSSATDANDEGVDEDLPEWEPLTPELVEDEAIRGDFMLRWAVVLIAFLLGCTEIASTETLVHIKSGQYLAANGLLPPANDVFSYTAAERRWVNVSWLFDLLSAGLYGVGGSAALSLFTAVVAAATFVLVVHISKPNIPTWWGSIISALTLLVCYPQFTAQPEIITLLGIAVTLWQLEGWKQKPDSKRLWALVPIFLLWGNLDSRMFLGLLLLVFYGLGESLGSLLGRPSLIGEGQRKQYWTVTCCCLIAAIINPFGWHTLAAPFVLYSTVYPALQSHYRASPTLVELQYFPMVGLNYDVYWSVPTYQMFAGVLLLLIAVVTLWLNRRHTDFGHVTLVLGFGVLAMMASHELAAACIVATVIATLNAQTWYASNFRLSYSIDTAEVFFSRGGRALTVLGFFAFAYVAVSGHLMGANGRRIGLGFEYPLQEELEGYRTQLVDELDDRPFHARFRQGDVLIWIGKKVFVDSRVALYAGSGDDDLLALHNRTRRALRPRLNELGKPDRDKNEESYKFWSGVFSRYKISHVVPRLSGHPAPDYVTFFSLAKAQKEGKERSEEESVLQIETLTGGSSDALWQLTDLGGVAAVFYRTDTTDPEALRFLEEHKIDFISEAFRNTRQSEGEEELALRYDWARPPSFYSTYLSQRKEQIPNSVLLANHYLTYLSPPRTPLIGVLQLPQETAIAFCYLAIRECNKGLIENPHCAEAFFTLARTYHYLSDFEEFIAYSNGQQYSDELRYFQIVNSLNQAVTADPDNIAAIRSLYELYVNRGRLDLGLRWINRYLELSNSKFDTSPASAGDQTRLLAMQAQLQNQSTQIDENVAKALEESPRGRLAIANQLSSSGFLLKALEVLEGDQIMLFDDPEAKRLQGRLLMECGRLSDASEVFEQLQNQAERIQLDGWRFPAAVVSMANGNLRPGAEVLWRAELNQHRTNRLEQLASTLPFRSPPLPLVGNFRDSWPIRQTVTGYESLYTMSEKIETAHWHLALTYLELDDHDKAVASFQSALEANPESPRRPVIAKYLELMTGETVETEPPSNMIPVSAEMFAEEEGNEN